MGRKKVIIYGVPACLIEDILVNRVIEKNQIKFDKVKERFSKCYIFI